MGGRVVGGVEHAEEMLSVRGRGCEKQRGRIVAGVEIVCRGRARVEVAECRVFGHAGQAYDAGERVDVGPGAEQGGLVGCGLEGLEICEAGRESKEELLGLDELGRPVCIRDD